MNDTEKRAYIWLQVQGYKDIVFRRRATPNFVIEDGSGFEVKMSRNNVIYFGPNQLDNLERFENQLTVLIFDVKGTEPIAQIPFDEIRRHPEFWRNYRIKGWELHWKPPAEIITSEEGVKSMLLRLEEVAKRLGISYPAARMLVLYDQKLPYFKVGARGIRVRETDLEDYIEKQRQKEGEKATESQSDTRESYEGRGILSKGEGK